MKSLGFHYFKNKMQAGGPNKENNIPLPSGSAKASLFLSESHAHQANATRTPSTQRHPSPTSDRMEDRGPPSPPSVGSWTDDEFFLPSTTDPSRSK